MKIKRYMAASMRAALSQVREEQGPNAVILSSRRVDEGIEVSAAVDYDEALFIDARRQRTPAMAAEAKPPAAPAANPPAAPAPSGPVRERPAPASAAPVKMSAGPVTASPAPV